MNNPTDPPDEEYRPRPGMPTTTGGSATASTGGRAAAAGAADATGTSDVPDGDPQPGQAGGAAAATTAAAADSRTGTTRSRRTARQGTVSYQEQVQAPNHSPSRVSHMNRWNGHLAGLLKFREENGHCNVPQEYPPNPEPSISSPVAFVNSALPSARKVTAPFAPEDFPQASMTKASLTETQ